MPPLTTPPRRTALSPDFLEMLRRNGLQAHLANSGTGPVLVVRTQDSPYKTYPISQQQLSDLTYKGAASGYKKAFSTLCDVIGRDFDVPQSYIAFSNANSHVNMGLHGYAVTTDEYRRGNVEVLAPSPGTLGHMMPNQAGYHLRRTSDSVIVPERADGSIRPGELLSGTYGFYYKSAGQNVDKTQDRQMSETVIDGLARLNQAVGEQSAAQQSAAPVQDTSGHSRTFPPADRYSDLIYSDMAFSNEKWLECLSSHGIVIDQDKATLTIESSVTGQDRTYSLTDNELHYIAQSDNMNYPPERRLEMISAIISPDFRQPVTMEMLDSDRHIDFQLELPILPAALQPQPPLRPSVPSEEEIQFRLAEGQVTGRQMSNMHADGNWRFFTPEGRRADVTSITVESAPDRQYRITAVIDGRSVSHVLSERQYDKLVSLDDTHRMRMVDRLFPELDIYKMETRSRSEIPVKLSAAIFAAASVTADVVLGVHSLAPAPPSPARVPVLTASQPGVYYKPGVDTPADVAARQFDALRVAAENDQIHIHR